MYIPNLKIMDFPANHVSLLEGIFLKISPLHEVAARLCSFAKSVARGKGAGKAQNKQGDQVIFHTYKIHENKNGNGKYLY